MKKRILNTGLMVFVSAVLVNGVPVWAEEEEGEVLNIYTWNEELKNRLENHYPGYKIVDDTTGTIGEVTVSWNIASGSGSVYQDSLDAALSKQEKAKDDEKVDLFLIEAEYAQKYVDTDVSLNILELGLTEEDLSGQFPYTKEIVMDSEGNLKGTAWQSCPGFLIYRRNIAKEVLGTDDPKEVQKSLADWDTFMETAGKMKEAGYCMTSSADDLYSVFTNRDIASRSNEENWDLEEEITGWQTISGELEQAGMTNTEEMWSEDWRKGFYTDGNVFCYFGSAWFYKYLMESEEEGSVGLDGGWAVTQGPQPFYWGGTWICCAAGTDNPTLAKEIMWNLTCNTEMMTDIAKAEGDFMNNADVMEALAEDESFSETVLGGQNPISEALASASAIHLTNQSGDE